MAVPSYQAGHGRTIRRKTPRLNLRRGRRYRWIGGPECPIPIYSIARWWQLKDFVIFTPILGEMIPMLTHIFQIGWNHQLEYSIVCLNFCLWFHLFLVSLALESFSSSRPRAPLWTWMMRPAPSNVRETWVSAFGEHSGNPWSCLEIHHWEDKRIKICYNILYM